MDENIKKVLLTGQPVVLQGPTGIADILYSVDKPQPHTWVTFKTREGHFSYQSPTEIHGCTCADCLEQSRSLKLQLHRQYRYSSAYSTEEAGKITRAYAKQINDDFQFLTIKLSSHADTILNRWKKKSRDQRAATILNALPSIYPKPFFEPTFLYTMVGEEGTIICEEAWEEAKKEFRTAKLLPFLNLETLMSDPCKFLALLHYRTAFSPEYWVSFHRWCTKTSWYDGSLETQFAACCIVLYGPDYGDTVTWDKAKAHRWDIVSFPRARLILESQHILMKFLRAVVEELFVNVKTERSARVKWEELAKCGFRTSPGTASWYTFSNQPYSSPSIDFDRLLEIAQSQLAETEDHLWLMQTDAQYFHSYLHFFTSANFTKSIQDHIIADDTWRRPTHAVEYWMTIVTELKHTHSQHKKYRNEVSLGTKLPQDYDRALGCLELVLINRLQSLANDFFVGLARIPAYEKYFKIENRDGKITYRVDTEVVGPSLGFTSDPIFWCLHQLVNASPLCPDDLTKVKYGAQLFDPAMLFEFLDNHFQAKTPSKGQPFQNHHLMRGISELATTYELYTAICQHRPFQTAINTTDAKKWASGRTMSRRLFGFESNSSPKNQMTVGKLLRNFISTPFPRGRRDEKWLAQADLARQASRSFWNEAKTHYLEPFKLLESFSKHDYDIIERILSYDSSADHLAALEAEKNKILSPRQRTTLETPPAFLNTYIHEQTRSTFAIPQPSAPKTKTRPDQSATIPESLVSPATPKVVETPPPKLQLKRDSIAVFLRMFPIMPEEYLAKPLDWRRFCQAMTDAGFQAAQSGGSAVAFIKPGEGRIVFHQPHPTPKIEQDLLQSWGLRMRKWFAWEREIFELREKVN